MRQLVVLLAMAFVALAASAPTSFAETEEPDAPSSIGTVSSEVAGEDCPDVTRNGHDDVTGGCVFHATGEAVGLTSHTIFGESLQFACNYGFTAHIDSSGEGWIPISNVSIAHDPGHPTSNCGHAAEQGVDRCSAANAEAEGHPGDWHIQGFEDTASGDEWLLVEPCLEGTASGVIHGHLWMRVSRDDSESGSISGFEAEDHRLTEVHGTSFDMEFDGHWSIEANDELEFAHP